MMICTTHTRDDGSTLLVVSGDIDMSCVKELREIGLGVLARVGGTEFLLDLMDVPFIDSTGLGALIALRNAADEGGTHLALLDPSERVMAVLEITKLADVFDIRRTNFTQS